MQNIQLSGSEVMGLMASGYRLAPTDDSLQTVRPDRLRHSLYDIANTLPCLWQKVKCFRAKEFRIIEIVFVQSTKPKKLPRKGVDKRKRLWFNVTCTHIKDVDGKLAYAGCSREPAGGASRCGWRKRSDSRVGSVKGMSLSNGTRLSPLQE